MNFRSSFRFLSLCAFAAVAPLLIAFGCCCHDKPPCTADCPSGGAGGGPAVGAGGQTTHGFTGPSGVSCNPPLPANYCTSGGAPTAALPKCAHWSGCELDTSAGHPPGKFCTWSPSVECVEGQVLPCNTSVVTGKGVMTCDTTTCKFNAFTGAGACRRCGTAAGDPCCPGPSACPSGLVCGNDTQNADNKYTGVCVNP